MSPSVVVTAAGTRIAVVVIAGAVVITVVVTRLATSVVAIGIVGVAI